MIWDLVNSLGRLLLTVIVIILITRLRHLLNALERIGLGFAGAGSFLTIPVIWQRHGSPFEGWATTLLTYGALMAWVGFGWRKLRHDQRNAQAVAEATARLQSRGKL